MKLREKLAELEGSGEEVRIGSGSGWFYIGPVGGFCADLGEINRRLRDDVCYRVYKVVWEPERWNRQGRLVKEHWETVDTGKRKRMKAVLEREVTKDYIACTGDRCIVVEGAETSRYWLKEEYERRRPIEYGRPHKAGR